MQFSPAISAAKSVINNKYLGKIISFKLFTYRFTDWSIWPWLEKIDYPESYFDCTYCFASTWYFPDLYKSIDEMIRVTKKNGLLFFK